MTVAVVPGTVYAGTAGHEARHLAAAVLLGLKVKNARADCPDDQRLGYVTIVGPMATPREFGLMVLVGPLDEDSWPPEWPSKSAETSDECQLAEVVERLALDHAGYLALQADAWKLAALPLFKRLEVGFETLLERGHILDQRDIAHVKAIVEKAMRTKTMEMKTTVATSCTMK